MHSRSREVKHNFVHECVFDAMQGYDSFAKLAVWVTCILDDIAELNELGKADKEQLTT